MATQLGTPVDNNHSPVTEASENGFQARQVDDSELVRTSDLGEPPADEEPEPAETANASEIDLEAELEAHEAELSESAPQLELPDFTAPEYAELSNAFKESTGFDLAEAAETFAAMQAQLAELQQAQQQNESESAAKTLMSNWGVQDAEFNRRVDLVLKYVSKMSPERQALYDSVDGIDLVWKRISKDKTPSTTRPAASASAASTAKESKGKTFKKSELRDMALRNPRAYQAMESEIDRAYKLGNIVNDL